MDKNISSISGVEDVELLFPKYDKKNNYHVHNCNYHLVDFIKKINYNGIIMTSTFLDHVKRYDSDSSWINQYSFLKDTKAYKVVFSQDDYWLSSVRDDFYTKYKIDLVLPSVLASSWEDLLPKYFKSGNMIQGYTSYLTPHIESLSKYSKPWKERKIDFFYRASSTSSFPNKLGKVKSEIGKTFENTLNKETVTYNLDIETIDYNSGNILTGRKWYEYLGNSKATLGSNSGSSVKIKNHLIAEKVNKALEDKKNFDSVLEQIPYEDQEKNYTGISPRNLEAAFTKTLQILVPGQYGNILKPYHDYIPLQEDCSNIKEVLEIFSSQSKCEEIIDNCYNSFKDFEDISVRKTLKLILSRIESKQINIIENHYQMKIVKFKLILLLPFLKFINVYSKVIKKLFSK